jgi:hypothetical protein
VAAGIDGIGNTNDDVLRATAQHIADASAALTTANLARADSRLVVLGALHALDLGEARQAIDLGTAMAKRPPLPPWQRALFGTKLDRLRAFESWQPFFAR